MKSADAITCRLGGVMAALLLAAMGGGASGAQAAGGNWNVQVEAVELETLGHDQHVLTTRETDRGGSASRANAVTLDTEAALGYRGSVVYRRTRWGFGGDFVIFRTDQRIDPVRAAAGGEVERRAFEVAGRRFTSEGPGQTLVFQTLEDTTVELWIFDLYSTRVLAETPGAALEVILGLRNADFDNDYRALAGIDGVGGVRIDASSNYGRMIGPLLGLAARFDRGRHSVRGDLRQAVVLGEIELSRTLRDFTGPLAAYAGPPEEVPAGFAREHLRSTIEDIAVPMTDLRLSWEYRLTERLALGLSLGATAWWDLAVPPGVVPGRDQALEENTLVTYGLGGAVRYTF